MMFRTLNPKEQEDFRNWARDHTSPEHLAKAEIYHPVVRSEWRRMGLYHKGMTIEYREELRPEPFEVMDGTAHRGRFSYPEQALNLARTFALEEDIEFVNYPDIRDFDNKDYIKHRWD